MKKQGFLKQILIFTLAWFSSINMNTQAETLIHITQVSGKVFLNTGTNYIVAQAGMKLNPGDRILALQDSSARLDYPNHCAIQVNPNSLFTVGKEDQCLQAANRSRKRRPLQQLSEQDGTVIVPAEKTGSVVSATSAVIAIEGAGAVGAASAAGPTLLGTAAVVAGIGGVAAGTAAIATQNSDSHNNNPISPE